MKDDNLKTDKNHFVRPEDVIIDNALSDVKIEKNDIKDIDQVKKVGVDKKNDNNVDGGNAFGNIMYGLCCGAIILGILFICFIIMDSYLYGIDIGIFSEHKVYGFEALSFFGYVALGLFAPFVLILPVVIFIFIYDNYIKKKNKKENVDDKKDNK